MFVYFSSYLLEFANKGCNLSYSYLCLIIICCKTGDLWDLLLWFSWISWRTRISYRSHISCLHVSEQREHNKLICERRKRQLWWDPMNRFHENIQMYVFSQVAATEVHSGATVNNKKKGLWHSAWTLRQQTLINLYWQLLYQSDINEKERKFEINGNKNVLNVRNGGRKIEIHNLFPLCFKTFCTCFLHQFHFSFLILSSSLFYLCKSVWSTPQMHRCFLFYLQLSYFCIEQTTLS